jgi:predicted ATPase/class 3 adenylate cyclase
MRVAAASALPAAVIDIQATAVTYLFSDIEGSTRLWEQAPERAGPLLAWHDEVTRATVQAHRGTVVKMTGDGVHAVFGAPVDALAAAVDLQLACTARNAGAADGIALRVRCGLHLGTDERRDGDFYGRAVNRAARIMGAAHGEQILLSAVVAERLGGRLPPQVTLRDLGRVRLRDLAGPEHLVQVVHPRLRSDFPPLRSLEGTPNNLPQQVNSFVGRDRDMAQVRAMLARARLLTLLGMGGLGKSRLSVQVAAAVLDEYPDGVWFVELAALSDPRSVPQAVASTLGVKEAPGASVLQAVVDYAGDKCLLLVLDNCEHVVQACAELARALLQAAPAVRVLASSRDGLRIAGETVLQVAPLQAPAAGAATSIDALQASDAVRLFVDRASAAQPGFQLTDKVAPAVAEICRRLDGIPLAIELAAARMRAMSAEQIAQRLDDRFRFLVRGDRTAPPRQQTLRALIDWSHDLLDDAERVLFRRLAVFGGGWTLEAAESVGAEGAVAREDVLELLTGLVEKSLVLLEPEHGRYRMLDTVRQYALEHLVQAGDEAPTRERHLAVYGALVESARPQLQGPGQGEWLAQLDRERDNVLAAHAWCAASPNGAELDLRLVSGLKFYWLSRGQLGLGLEVTREALGRSGAASVASRCRGLSDAGQICFFMGRYGEAKGYLLDALALARTLDPPTRLLTVLNTLTLVEAAVGETASALAYSDEAVGLAQVLGNRRSYAGTVMTRGQLLRLRGDLAGARTHYEEALAVVTDLGDHEAGAIAKLNLAMVAITEEDAATARTLLRQVWQAAASLGSVAVGQTLLDVCAAMAALDGQWRDSARFFGAAEAQAERSAIRRDPADRAFMTATLQRSRQALRDEWPGVEGQGRALPYAEAIVQAREYLERLPRTAG